MKRCLFALVLLLGAAILHTRAAGAAPLRVAVLDFTAATASAEYAPLGKGLQSMITTDLAQLAALSLVERARLKDLEAELKLVKSGAVDKTTAVRLGKLAGASHLLTGSFTVVGNKMRIDCHLLSVQNGSVVLADKVEGDKDVFFELEKDLVKKLVGAFGVAVAPKERAAVAKIHTADFEAFRRFSQSVDLFDAKRYDEAVATLREATTRDSEFKLASYTLAQYESLIVDLRSKAQTVESAQIDRRFLERQLDAKRVLTIMDKLAEIAERKQSDALTRAVALGALLSLQTNSNTPLYRVEDWFAMQRAADATAQRYWPLLKQLYPELPLGIERGAAFEPRDYDMRLDVLKDVGDFDKAFQAALAVAREHWPGHPNGKYVMSENTWKAVDDFERDGRRLNLDQHGIAELGATLYALAKKHVPDTSDWSSRPLDRIARAYRDALELDKSTAFYAQLANRSDNPGLMKRVAEEIELNRDAELALARLKPTALVREYLQCRFAPKELARLFPSDKLEAQAASELQRCRRWHNYLVVGGHAMFPFGKDRFSSSYQLFSGPRSDRLRTEEIVHYSDESGTGAETLTLFGQPRGGLALRFDVDYQPDSFVGPIDKDARGQRPELSFVFGVRDVDADLRDEKTRALVRPTHGYALRLLGDEVQLAEARRTEQSNGQAFAFTEVTSTPAALAGQVRYSVQIKLVENGHLEIEIAGTRARFKTPKEARGFLGFVTRGPGLVAIRNVQLGS